MLDEESKDRIYEFTKELKALMDERDLRFWEGCVVQVAPAGGPPAFCTVEIEGVYDESVEWRGAPPAVNVGDEVLVWENPLSHRREIIGGSGATASFPPLGVAHEIFKMDAAGTAAGFEPAVWAELVAPAGATMVHDHFNAAGGGQDLNPERISARVVLCGPGLPNATLGAAVIRVNALGPPALNNEWVIKVMGRTTETGPVAIPAYCFVECEEGAAIGMGANLLAVAASGGLSNAIVESQSNPGIDARGTLRNVTVDYAQANGVAIGAGAGASNPCLYRCIVSSVSNNVTCFYLSSASRLYRCRAESGGGNNLVGFYVAGGAANYLLEHCLADDTTNINTALWVANVSAVLTTRRCSFRAAPAGNDVNLGAQATWYHIKCEWDVNNSTIAGTETPLRDGAVEIARNAIRSHNSLLPTLGTTTLAQKLGHVYLGPARDIYPDHDAYGLWGRLINFGRNPDEHWHQNADDLVWTGWAGYVGYVTPDTLSRTNSMLTVRHAAAGNVKAFYYRAAATGANIFLRTRVSESFGCLAGIMIDDGVDAADGEGANNFYRVVVDGTAGITNNWQITRQYRVGAGAVVTNSCLSLPPAQFYGLVLAAVMNPNWASWWAGTYNVGEHQSAGLLYFDNPPFTWTPVRVGVYWASGADTNVMGFWDWYDEASS